MKEAIQILFGLLKQVPYGTVAIDFLQNFPPALAFAGFVIGFCVASDIFANRGKRQVKIIDGLCTWSNYISFLFGIALGIYLLYTDTNQLMHYFIVLVAGAVVSNLVQTFLSWLGVFGWPIAVALALSSGVVSGWVAWLYYKGALLQYLL